MKVKIAMRNCGVSEVLMIAFAHDVNFIFGFHVGTSIINGTFRDNWNLDLSKMSMPLDLFMTLIDDMKGQFCL
jgi:hypothetical protein